MVTLITYPARSGSWGDDLNWRSTLLTIVALALMAAAVVLLPLTLAILAIIGLVMLRILLDALGNRMLFKMALRNVLRRPSTTALVLGGLMIGTAIISASLVVGDTLDNMIVGETTKAYGDVDFTIAGNGTVAESPGLYSLVNVSAVRGAVLAVDHVDGAEWVLEAPSSIRSVGSNLTQPSVGTMGLTDATVARFGGFIAEDGTPLDHLPAAGHAYVNEKLAASLGIADGGTVMLATDHQHVVSLTADIVRDERMAAMGPKLFLDLSTAQQLSGMGDVVNMLLVTLDDSGRANVNATRADLNSTIAAFPDLELRINNDRAQAIVEGRSSVSMFTSLFFVFGSFSIIAGIALIINIFTMLGEERKGEMGVARAVGMKRGHLRKLFTYEGLLYAAVAAAIGTGVGLILAYVLIIGAGALISTGDVVISDYFAFAPFSLSVAYLAGFVLTLVTIYLVTFRISNMNIVRAVRNIPEPLRSRTDKGLLRLGLLAFVAGAMIMFLGVEQQSLALASSGLSLVTLSLGLLLRRFTGDRLAWTVAGLATLFVWLPKGFEIFPYSGDIEMFVISGVFMVTSLLIVVMFNSDSIVRFFTMVLRTKGGYRAVIKTAISYPLRAKVRTGLSIFIFGLVIFTVTTLSMMSGMLSVGIPQMVEETSGGFDIVAFSAAPVDMWGTINGTPGLVDRVNVTSIIQLSQADALVTMNRTDPATNLTAEATFRYDAIGIDPDGRLYTEGNYPLKQWNTTRFASETDVWNAARSDPSLVILDGTAGEGNGEFGISMGSSEISDAKVGDTLQLTDLSGNNSTVTVIGVTKQSTFHGVFMNSGYVNDDLGVNGTNLFLIKLAGNVDADRQATLIQNEFWEAGVYTIPMKTVAHQAVSQIDGMFNLIKAFLALGLIIGITGLGIITIRSIRERTIEIGMMRAIGYTRRMVVANFALESAFVSVLGILIGSVLGIVVGYQLWQSAFQDMGIDFLIPWWPILLVGGLAFIATLLSVYPAARGASKVSPAEVLRFE
ncbi:MAG: FtsX-like permease family protein [Methanomassiliicoccus sp.]|nr:FtsX-like permease family protein [Methanomassiliicoccus sp.]